MRLFLHTLAMLGEWMKRYFPLGALMMFLLTGGVTISTTSKAQLIFSFSVTNTAGTVAGTFKGEIFGLIDNSTSSATKVLIESFPSGLNSLASPPVDAILWNQQNQNSFTVSGGRFALPSARARSSAQAGEIVSMKNVSPSRVNRTPSMKD